MNADERQHVHRLLSCVERSASMSELTLDEQQTLLDERQSVLDAVQGFDTSRWTTAEKREVGQALEALLQHTLAAATALQAQVESVIQSQQQVAQGREALRGYRPDMKRSSRTVNRTA